MVFAALFEFSSRPGVETDRFFAALWAADAWISNRCEVNNDILAPRARVEPIMERFLIDKIGSR